VFNNGVGSLTETTEEGV